MDRHAAATGLNIALVCDYALDYLGGAQSAFLDQAAILRSHGHSVTIFAPAGRGGTRRLGPAEIPGTRDGGGRAASPEVARFPVRSIWTVPGVDLPLVRNTAALRDRLRTAFASRRIDVVHLHSEFGLTAAAIVAARELEIPVVHTVHTFFWQAHVPRRLDRLAGSAVRGFARALRGFRVSPRRLAPSATDSALRAMTLSTAERADVVISPSIHQARRLTDSGLANVVVVENATPRGAAGARPLVAAEPPVRIVWIGRMTPEKRVLEFVRAAMSAQQVLGPGALTVELVGSGPLSGEVEAVVASEGSSATSDIRLLGRLTRGQVRERIRESHLVALTSLGFDNQPVVVVEAFNEARSVLYVDEDLQEGLSEAGILAASADVAGMAETLVELARNPDLLIERSRMAHRSASIFAPERHAELLRGTYESARRVAQEWPASAGRADAPRRSG